MRRLIPLLLAIGVVALTGTSALAARSSSSISLQMISASTSSSSTNTAPFGSTVTFNVSTTATAFPWVEVMCYQGKLLVYGQVQGFFASYYTAPNFTLGPTLVWSGGSASCTATLFSDDGGKRRDLTSTSFAVA
jgi:hypothetical protein